MDLKKIHVNDPRFWYFAVLEVQMFCQQQIDQL